MPSSGSGLSGSAGLAGLCAQLTLSAAFAFFAGAAAYVGDSDGRLGVNGCLSTFGHDQVGHSEDVTRNHGRDVEFKYRGDCSGTSTHCDDEELLVNSTISMTNFNGVTNDDDRYFNGHGLVSAGDLKVDVLQRAAHGVALELTSKDEIALLATDQLDQLVGASVAGKGNSKVRAIHGHRDRVAAVSIDDTRNLALATEPTSDPSTGLAADLSSKSDFGHGVEAPWGEFFVPRTGSTGTGPIILAPPREGLHRLLGQVLSTEDLRDR
jgi:hypothetical protein